MPSSGPAASSPATCRLVPSWPAIQRDSCGTSPPNQGKFRARPTSRSEAFKTPVSRLFLLSTRKPPRATATLILAASVRVPATDGEANVCCHDLHGLPRYRRGGGGVGDDPGPEATVLWSTCHSSLEGICVGGTRQRAGQRRG